MHRPPPPSVPAPPRVPAPPTQPPPPPPPPSEIPQPPLPPMPGEVIIRKDYNPKGKEFIICAATRENRIFVYAKTKAQISFAETAKLISAFLFATRIVESLFFLNPKFQALSLILDCTDQFVSDVVGNPNDRFSYVAAHFKHDCCQLVVKECVLRIGHRLLHYGRVRYNSHHYYQGLVRLLSGKIIILKRQLPDFRFVQFDR